MSRAAALLLVLPALISSAAPARADEGAARAASCPLPGAAS